MLRDFTLFGYALIPLDLAAHMAHNLFHLLGEGLAVPRSMVLWLGGDVGGQHGAAQHADDPGAAVPDARRRHDATVYAAYRIARSVPVLRSWRALVPQLLLIALLVAVNVYMFAQPMGHRA